MFIRYLRNLRRQRLSDNPFPDEWRDILVRNVLHYNRMNQVDQRCLENVARIIACEKHWHGIDGFHVTDEVKLTVSAQAALLLLAIEHDYFGRTSEIIIHPSNYKVAQQYRQRAVVINEATEYLGQAYYRGPVVLSWAEALAGGRDEDDGRNLVLHEFAHKLDMADDSSDGTPYLRSRAQYEQWFEVMTREYEALRQDVRSRKRTLLDRYGAKNEPEFFACATECFFERPREMRDTHPALYDVLMTYYRQNPAARFEA